jgi:MFS family permease
MAFFIWEAYGAKYPMFPRRLQQDRRVLSLTLLITWISGANFFSVLMFWPTESYNVYDHDPVGVGLRGLPVGFSILAGACIILVLLSILRGKIRFLMILSTSLMTLGTGLMALANPNNMGVIYVILVIAGLGIGGILIPASIITTIVCPG